MSETTRRAFLLTAGAPVVAALLPAPRRAWAEGPAARAGITLGFGTYGMKGTKLEDAIRSIAAIGFDSVEIAAHPGFDGEPATMPADRRRVIRSQIGDSGLTLASLMENLPPADDDQRHRADVARLRQVMELARDLAPDAPPLVQTVLGGGTWDAKKDLFRDRLAEWQDVARETKVVLAIKPHRGGAMTRPEEAAWLIDQLGRSPWLRMVYDPSHYAFRDMPVEATLRAALPITAHVAVKDAVQRDGKVQFLLPGEGGTLDYADLLRRLADGGYRGDVCCEVSSMISGKPGYAPVEAARVCYGHLARAFREAGVPRHRASGTREGQGPVRVP